MSTTTETTSTCVVERVIAASQETLFSYWTDSEKITQWLAADADLEPRPGGKANLDMGSHLGVRLTSAENKFIAVDPYSHIEFTWGFDEPEVGVAPGSSVVVVDLIAQDEGTLVRVTHRDLPAQREESPFSEFRGWPIKLEELDNLVAS